MAELRWTSEQAAALTATEDVLLVANAGTGKTTTVVGKILWLLGLDVGKGAETGEPIPRCPDPCGLHEIAAVTFTEKAAYDLKRKLRQEIARSERAAELRWEVDRASVGTIHAFCGGILREHALRLGIDPTFRVLDAAETRAALTQVMREVLLGMLEAGDEDVGRLYRQLGMTQFEGRGGVLALTGAALRELRWHEARLGGWTEDDGLSAARLRELCAGLVEWTDGSDDDAVRSCDAVFRLARATLARWNAFLEDENAKDFDAMILDARSLLAGSSGEAALAELRRRYRVLIVDEFQDTDAAQRDVVFAIGGERPRPQLFLVGDPKQSIYRFRGADVSVWNEVERALADGGRVLPLTRNFRSTPAVVDYANAVSHRAMEETGAGVDAEGLPSRVRYAPLTAGRTDGEVGAAERVTVPVAKPADARRVDEAKHLAARILEMRGRLEVMRDGGRRRACRFSDIAVLYRSNTGLELYERALREHAVPYFNAQPPKLEDQQEVADLLNALRLVENPRDDLRAFAWLRSPFVGLRDEVIARVRLDGGRGSLLRQARDYLGNGAWYEAPEHPEVAALERGALARGLAAFDEARRLSYRIPLDELAELLLERTGYREHLVLLGREREAWPNLEAFIRHLESYRDHLIGSFLEIWDRRDPADPGLPQAPLYSAEDDVVTLTTVHRAKGLEWPVVFLIDVCGEGPSHRTNQLLVDPRLGPGVVPKKEGRGARAEALVRRDLLEEEAEEARILYVAVTRARDRLAVVAPAEGKGYLPWLEAGSGLVRPSLPNVAAARPARGGEAVSLAWLDRVVGGAAPEPVRVLGAPPLRATTSATELMMKEGDPERWRLRYVHGVQPSWEFAPRFARGGAPGVPAHLRGTLIHGVLERIEEARELSRVLDETIGELDNPELETLLRPGAAYREALEQELRRVLESEEWRWYVDGEHWRELPFTHLEERPWRLGSFDLYRSDHPHAWIIDFKTHEVERDGVEKVAAGYRLQVGVHTAAARVKDPARMRLHFTHAGVVVEGGGVT